jgi:Zn-dependent protease
VIAVVTGDNAKLALFLLVALVPAFALHEFAHAWVADRMGDPTPRRYGRLTLNPRPHVDNFGSLVLPAILILLVAAGAGPPVFAYSKPMPLNPFSMRNPRRMGIFVTLAGPAANLVLAIVFAVALRLVGSGGDLTLLLAAGLIVNVVMLVFQLMPIPGLDGSRLLAPVLPPRAQEVYRNMEQYVALFMLVIFFLLSAPVVGIVRTLGNALCGVLVGADCI